MLEIFSITIQSFIIIGLGTGISFFVDKEKWVEVLNKYGLYIGFPAIIISSLTKMNNYSNFDFSFVSANLFILLISMAFVLLILKSTKLSTEIKNTYVICCIFGNAAYLGFPFVTSLFPNSHGLVSIFVAINIFVVFTAGVLILDLSQKKSIHIVIILKNLLMNPLLVAVLLGVALVLFNITIPPLIRVPIEMVASSGSPIVLLSLGIFISRKIQFNKIFLHASIISSFKLIALPVIFILLLPLFHISKIEVSVSTIEAAMPLAITPFALAEIYPMDKEIVAVTIFISTIVSIFSLAAFSLLVR